MLHFDTVVPAPQHYRGIKTSLVYIPKWFEKAFPGGRFVLICNRLINFIASMASHVSWKTLILVVLLKRLSGDTRSHQIEDGDCKLVHIRFQGPAFQKI